MRYSYLMTNRAALTSLAYALVAASIVCLIRGWTVRHFVFGVVGGLSYGMIAAVLAAHRKR